MGLFDALRRKNSAYSVYDELDENEISVTPTPERKLVAQEQPVSQEKAKAQTYSQRAQRAQERESTPGISSLKMQVLRPTEFREVTKVADCLKEGQAVVLNLENVDETDGKRMIDYLAGVLYALDGKIERPAQRTFLLTPSGISVASEDVARLHPEK